MKIVCYNEFLVNSTKPKIDSAKNKLNVALTKSQSIVIPADFQRKNDLVQVKESLSRISNELTNYSNWLTILNNKLVSLDEETAVRINNITNVEIKNKNELL